MTIEQVGNMFGEAKRMDDTAKFLKLIQTGALNKADFRSIQKKDADYYQNLAINP